MKNQVSFYGIKVNSVEFKQKKDGGEYVVIVATEQTSTKSSYQFLAYDDVAGFIKKSNIRKGDNVDISGYMKRYIDKKSLDRCTSIIITRFYNLGDLGDRKQMANTICFFDLEVRPQMDQSSYKVGKDNVVVNVIEPSLGNQMIKLVAFDKHQQTVQNMQLSVGDHICCRGTLQKYEVDKNGHKTYPVTCKISEIEKIQMEKIVKVAEREGNQIKSSNQFSSVPTRKFG